MRAHLAIVLSLCCGFAAPTAGASLLVSFPSLQVDVTATVQAPDTIEEVQSALDDDASDGLAVEASASLAPGGPMASVSTTGSTVLSTDRIDVAFSTDWSGGAAGSPEAAGYRSDHRFSAVLTIPADGELHISWQLGKIVNATPSVTGSHGFDYSLGIVAIPGGNFGSGSFQSADMLSDGIVLPVSADDVVSLEISGSPNALISGDFSIQASLDASIAVEYVAAPEPEVVLLDGVAAVAVLGLARRARSRPAL